VEDGKYKVSLEGAGLKLDREVDQTVGEQIAVLILTGSKPSGLSNTSGFVTRPATAALIHETGGSLSLREFLNEHEPRRSPDKIVAIGLYLRDSEGKSTFSKEDLEKAFESCGEKIPANLSRDIQWTIRSGWIAPKSGLKGSYYVTNSGDDAVVKKFPKELLKKTPVDRKKASKKRAG